MLKYRSNYIIHHIVLDQQKINHSSEKSKIEEIIKRVVILFDYCIIFTQDPLCYLKLIVIFLRIVYLRLFCVIGKFVFLNSFFISNESFIWQSSTVSVVRCVVDSFFTLRLYLFIIAGEK